jgi:3-oxoacyl-[acyl-carrier-protein] synthase III
MSAPPPIGIAGVATELADLRVGSEDFARISNIPLQVVEQKLGFKQLFRWGSGQGPMATGVRCARRALGGMDAREVDLICTVAHPYHAEREIYGFGALLQDLIGAERAEVMDIADTCASITLGIQTVRELMIAEPHIKNVLIVGVVTMLDMLDFSNPRTTWMANLSDGAGAMLLRRDPTLDNVVLESAQVADPTFIDDVLTASPYLKDPISYRHRFRRFLPWYIEVVNKDSMKDRLDKVALPGFAAAIKESLERSGFRADQVDYIGANTMKPSMWRGLLDNFKLKPEGQIYLEEAGHVGYLDQFFFIQKIREERKLPQGGVAVLATPGVGFHWTATTIAFKGPRVQAVAP